MVFSPSEVMNLRIQERLLMAALLEKEHKEIKKKDKGVKLMGKINETLTLTDQFSSSFHTFINLGGAGSFKPDFCQQWHNRSGLTVCPWIGENQTVHWWSNTEYQSDVRCTPVYFCTGNEWDQTDDPADWCKSANHTEETKRTGRAAGDLLRIFRQIAVATGAVSLVRSFLGVADQQTQITARLNLMNDGLQSTAELQDMIYVSAQRTRSAYDATAQVVAGLGQRAGKAFLQCRDCPVCGKLK